MKMKAMQGIMDKVMKTNFASLSQMNTDQAEYVKDAAKRYRNLTRLDNTTKLVK
jgi:hypothetical protein